MLKKYYEASNKQLYSDANGTLRVTYGNVAGVSLKDGINYEPFTRLRVLPRNILAKNHLMQAESCWN